MTDATSAPIDKNSKPTRRVRRRSSNDSNGNHDIADMAETYGIMASDPVWTGRKRDSSRDGKK